MDLNKLEEEAISFIKEHEPEGGYKGAFSGGKDSIVVHHLTTHANIKCDWYFSFTSIDPPEVVRFIKDNYPKVQFLYPNYKGKKSFFGMIPLCGLPHFRRRWCCTELKERPFRSLGACTYISGVRAEESSQRKKTGRVNKRGRQLEVRPIFDWLEYSVWEYIEKYKIPYCSLYDEGFDRIGCVVCMFHKPKHEPYMERWPSFFRAFEKAAYKLWIAGKPNGEPWQEKTFDEFLNTWYKGRPKIKKDL